VQFCYPFLASDILTTSFFPKKRKKSEKFLFLAKRRYKVQPKGEIWQDNKVWIL
jgi:hypothetical protein